MAGASSSKTSGAFWPSVTSVMACPSGALDARVDGRLQQIDDQVGGDETQSQNEDRALQHRNVAGQDRLAEQETGAGPGEDRLDQDRAADQIAELESHHREDLR